MVLDASLLNTQHYKVGMKGKVKQSRERSNALTALQTRERKKLMRHYLTALQTRKREKEKLMRHYEIRNTLVVSS